MARVRRHGGMCCGLSHVYNLPDDFEMRIDKEGCIEEFEEACKRAFKNNLARGFWSAAFDSEEAKHTIEVVTTDYDYDRFNSYLTSNGWKKTYSFLNGNSSNTCYVWHKSFVMSDFYKKNATVVNPFGATV